MREHFFMCENRRHHNPADDDHPIHYPRATANGQPGPPSPDGEAFKWFVANEKDGRRFALRDLWEDRGLPTLKK